MKKPRKLSGLIKSADDAMSKYIRAKYCGDAGGAKCVSCGQWKEYSQLQCGHFYKRQHFGTRYVEENCHVECIGCNCFDVDHLHGYTEYMEEMYGKEGIAELKKQSKRLLSPSEKRQIVEEALEYYTQAIKDL